MPEPIFKKGDIVFIKENAYELARKEGNRNGSPGFNDNMKGHLGEAYAIERVHTTGNEKCPYWYVIDSWKYKPEWLQPVDKDTLFEMYVNEQVDKISFESLASIMINEKR